MKTGTPIFKINKKLEWWDNFKHLDPKRPLSYRKSVHFCINLFLQAYALVCFAHANWINWIFQKVVFHKL